MSKVPLDIVKIILEMAFSGNAHKHNNGTKSLTSTEKKPKNQHKPKIVRTDHYECAYVTVMAVVIIFPVILQTIINFRMLSIGGQGVRVMKCTALTHRSAGR